VALWLAWCRRDREPAPSSVLLPLVLVLLFGLLGLMSPGVIPMGGGAAPTVWARALASGLLALALLGRVLLPPRPDRQQGRRVAALLAASSVLLALVTGAGIIRSARGGG